MVEKANSAAGDGQQASNGRSGRLTRMSRVPHILSNSFFREFPMMPPAKCYVLQPEGTA